MTEAHAARIMEGAEPLRVGEDDIAWAAASTGKTLDPSQRAALETALSAGLAVITGGPGTGKTTITRALIALFQKQGLRVKLGSPTGRASKRLQEATGHQAETVHRMLDYGADRKAGGEMRFRRNAESPLDTGVLLLDEARCWT